MLVNLGIERFKHYNWDSALATKFSKRNAKGTNKNALNLSVNVLSTKVLIDDTIFTSTTQDGVAILRGHPRQSLAV